LKSGFRKISRVSSLTGGTRWYLTDDCLLAAKRTMYAVEYRRFYLRDLECIVVWRRRSWMFRLIIPGVLLAALGASLWQWANSTAGEIFTGIALAWVLLELSLGPTSSSRIRTTGVSVDIALVKRARRAAKVLAAIDTAVRATREDPTQPAVPTPSLQTAGVSLETNYGGSAAAPSIAEGSQTNGL
jgi:hypothetical protein